MLNKMFKRSTNAGTGKSKGSMMMDESVMTHTTVDTTNSQQQYDDDGDDLEVSLSPRRKCRSSTTTTSTRARNSKRGSSRSSSSSSSRRRESTASSSIPLTLTTTTTIATTIEEATDDATNQVLCPNERARIATQKGLTKCEHCGIQTHNKVRTGSLRTKVQHYHMTNDYVYQGICIQCNPTIVPDKVLRQFRRSTNGATTTGRRKFAQSNKL